MKQTRRQFVTSLAAAAGGLLLGSHVRSEQMTQRVPILVHHRVHPDDDAPPVVPGQACGHVVLSTFIRQLNYLRDHDFSVVTHQDLYHWLQGEADLPPKPVLIDFDDNRGAVYDHAFPLLQQYGWRATCFVITALADSHLPKMQDDGSGWYTWMTWKELGELRDAGWTIGAHTRTHPNLRELEEAGRHRRIVAELRRSKKDIERKLGLTPFYFAYPNYASWNEATEAAVGQFYQTARIGYYGTTEKPFRYVTRQTNPLRLPAHVVSEHLSFAEFVAFVEQTATGDGA